jgi:hypothetical protein
VRAFFHERAVVLVSASVARTAAAPAPARREQGCPCSAVIRDELQADSQYR